MKRTNETTRTTTIIFGLLAAFVVLLAFQNCAPTLPLDGVVSSSSASVRATATPVPINTSIGSSGTYAGSTYDGICTSSFTDDPMALDTNADVPGGPLVAFNNPNGRAAFWNLSGGTLARASVCYMSTGTWTVQAVGDFDGDLNPDVIWRNTTTGDLVVWLMRGSTRISTALVANLPLSYNIEGVADFDGDGKADLLVRDASSNLSVLEMNGTSAPTTIAIGTVASTAHLMAIGSYYDTAAIKKKIALFFTDTTSTKLVWYMNGTALASQGHLPTGFTTTGSSTYTILGIGDFNGDSNSDFLLQDNSTGNLFMRYSSYNGTSFAVLGDSAINSPAPASWAFQGIANINGDLYSDWVWIVSGGTYPVLGYNPMSSTPGALSSIGYIRTGWNFFKYSHL